MAARQGYWIEGPEAGGAGRAMGRESGNLPGPVGHSTPDRPPLHQGELLGIVRRRLDLSAEVPDVVIAATIAAIAVHSEPRGRWLAAFNSPLGQMLAGRGADLNTALNTLVSLMPRPAS